MPKRKSASGVIRKAQDIGSADYELTQGLVQTIGVGREATMKCTRARNRNYILPVSTIGLLLLLGPLFKDTPRAQTEDATQGINMSVWYTEPTAELSAMKMHPTSNLNVTMNNINIWEVQTWQGDHPKYMIALHYVDANSDRTERRFVFVVRSSTGVPWIVADSPVREPNGASPGTSQTIWFAIDVDEALLRAGLATRSSWFTEVATSTMEIGITDQREIHVDGAEDSPQDKSAALTPLTKVEDIGVFLP